MTLEALRKDMVAAMKAKDKTTKDAVSSLVSAVKKAAIDEGCREDVPEAQVDRVILKEMKTVKEQLDTCPESREDLKAEYQARYDEIAKYAPKQMDAAEIKTRKNDSAVVRIPQIKVLLFIFSLSFKII